jgi:hypothetical protein
MARYMTSMLISRSTGDTFAFISDLRNAPTWDPQTVAAYKMSEGPIGTGTRFCLVGRLFGYRLNLPYEIGRYDPPRELVIAGETALLRYQDRITLVSDDLGTRLTYEAHLDLKGVFRLANPLLALLLPRIGDAATRGMAAAVEHLV